MFRSKSIIIQDKKINEIIGYYGPAEAVSHLFEEYRTAGYNKEDFVAALIARMCLLESRAQKKGVKG